MNINDYNIVPLEPQITKVEYVRPNYDLESKYISDAAISIKNRRDLKGVISGVEDGKVIVKIFNETYAIPPQDFDFLFFMHEAENKLPYNRSRERK